jgi:tetratricopeptide (TPR) repeat protein
MNSDEGKSKRPKKQGDEPPVPPEKAPEPEPGSDLLNIGEPIVSPDAPPAPPSTSRSSFIDLGGEPGGSSGGESIDWGDLVGQGGPSSHEAEATFDSPSDAEILGRVPPSQPAEESSCVNLLGGEGSGVGGAAELGESEVNLDEPPSGSSPSHQGGDSSSGIDLGDVVLTDQGSSASGHSSPAQGQDSSSSGLDLGEVVLADSGSSASGRSSSSVDLLGAFPDEPESKLSASSLVPPNSDTEAAMTQRGLDEAAKEDSAIASGFVLIDDPEKQLGDSGLDLGAPVSGVGLGGSSRDRIAEAVESGVDLLESDVLPTSEDALDAVVLENPPPMTETSAVDLAMSSRVESSRSRTDDESIDLGAPPPVSAEDREITPASSLESDAIDLGALVGGASASSASTKAPIAEEIEDEDALTTAAPSDADLSGDVEMREPPVREVGKPPRGKGKKAVPEEEPPAVPGKRKPALEEEPVAGKKKPTRVADVETEEYALAGAPGKKGGRAAVAEEEPEEVEEPEAPKGKEAAKPAKAKGGRGWLGGTLVGAVLGTAACLGVWVAGYEPPEGWRLGGSPKKTTPVGPGPQPVVTRPSVNDAPQLLKSGDLDKAAEALTNIQEANPAHRAARGELRLLQHLTKMEPGKAFNAGDENVKQAVADLEEAQKAKNPDGIFWLGQIRLMAGDTAGARKLYEDAAREFAADPVQKQRFETAINRLDARTPPAAPPPAGETQSRNIDWREALVLAVVSLQQPPDQPKPGEQPVVPEKEPGDEFWHAVKLAQQQKFAEAIKSLEAARKLHDTHRFSRLRKAQNPLSDPTEEIFLRSCDDLAVLWKLQERLRSGGYLDVAKSNDPTKAVEVVFAELDGAKTQAAAFQELSKKLITAKFATKPEEAMAGLDKLLTEKKTADEKIAKLEPMLETETKAKEAALDMAKQLGDKLKTTETTLTTTANNLKTEQTKSAALAKDKTDLEGVVGEVGKKLEAAKYVQPGSTAKAELLKGLDNAIATAKTADPDGSLRQARKEIDAYKETLAQRWKPEEMLQIWLPQVKNRDRRDASASALKDVARVADADVGPATKALASAVRGLVQRNEGDFDAARKSLDEAIQAAPEKAPWLDLVKQAALELSEPGAYYLPTARDQFQQGRSSDALTTLNQGVAAFPGRSGTLLALRGLVYLDLAREQAAKAGSPLAADAPGVADAIKDAQDAIAAKAEAEGNFAAGRIAEELGQYPQAQESYTKALAAHPDKDEQGSIYRLALARVLLRAQPKPAVTPLRGGEDKGACNEKGGLPVLRFALRFVPLREVAVLFAVQLQPPAAGNPAQREADRIADEILSSKDIDKNPLLKAQALALKGLWTQALVTYAEGLKPYLRREMADDLLRIINSHPALKRPDVMATPNPFEAEKHYANGLRFYFARNYDDAEREFGRAVQNDGMDARYFYFLGLSRYVQGKDFAEDFDQAARLELQERPGRAAVSVSLERVQGPVRRIVQDARNRAR